MKKKVVIGVGAFLICSVIIYGVYLYSGKASVDRLIHIIYGRNIGVHSYDITGKYHEQGLQDGQTLYRIQLDDFSNNVLMDMRSDFNQAPMPRHIMGNTFGSRLYDDAYMTKGLHKEEILKSLEIEETYWKVTSRSSPQDAMKIMKTGDWMDMKTYIWAIHDSEKKVLYMGERW